ncbi:MAG: Mrp/NBP35 family ATP-binding protein [Lentisphaeria bacterium]|nr:Mrp/NBP35 family ATP-binding protein [Lentisphaeria bacterium]
MSECSHNCETCASKDSCANNYDKVNEKMSRIKNKIFVLSGKGGVGKSTVAALIAVSLAKEGFNVGLLDVDFHGPNQPTLFKVQNVRLGATEDNELEPLEIAGIKLVSIGLLLEDADQAVIWRGPAKMGVLKQLLEETAWGDLDYLICDFPPGTGDEILSGCQLIEGDKRAVIVTTPQELSLADCRKCIDFCKKAELPVAGVVENMSYFVCDNCDKKHYIFNNGGGRQMAEKYGLKLIATLPIDNKFLAQCDESNIAVALKNSPLFQKELESVTEL